MKTNPFLARFASVPSLVAPEMRERFESALTAVYAQLQPTLDRAHAAGENMQDDDAWWGEPGSFRAALRPYVVKDGVLQIPVKGVLLHDFPYAFGSWATGYDYIWRAFERGMGDLNVKGIALVVDSPGGEVAGNFDLVDRMFALRGKKPVRAFAAEHAYSAAYSIASAADRIIVSRTGGVGSIGVVTAHVDVSKMIDDIGYKVTFIFAGKHKVDGNAYEPLPEAVKARIQKRIDALYAVFVSTVARNRSMDEQAVRETEALTFTAPEALSNGLADEIGALDDALAAYAADLSLDEGDEQMSDQKDKSAVDQAAVDAARAEGVTQGKTEGAKEGAKAERERIAAITGHEAAKTRRASAINIALKTDLTVEQAADLLATLPEDAASGDQGGGAGAGKLFEQAMDGGDNPNVGAGGDKSRTDADDEKAASILGDYRAVVGGKPEKKGA